MTTTTQGETTTPAESGAGPAETGEYSDPIRMGYVRAEDIIAAQRALGRYDEARCVEQHWDAIMMWARDAENRGLPVCGPYPHYEP